MKFSMHWSNFSAPRLRYTSRMAARRMVLALPLIVPLAAFAQTALPDYAWIGAGVRTRPAYDGSGAQRTDLIPTVRYYGKPWFARTTQGILEGGARMELAQGLDLGAQLAYEGGRLASESDFLRNNNVPDIKPGASVGLHVEWDQKLGRFEIEPVVLRHGGERPPVYQRRIALGRRSQPRMDRRRQSGGAAAARRRRAQPARGTQVEPLREREPGVPVLRRSTWTTWRTCYCRKASSSLSWSQRGSTESVTFCSPAWPSSSGTQNPAAASSRARCRAARRSGARSPTRRWPFSSSASSSG